MQIPIASGSRLLTGINHGSNGSKRQIGFFIRVVRGHFPGRSGGYAHPELRRRGDKGRLTASTLRFTKSWKRFADRSYSVRVMNVITRTAASMLLLFLVLAAPVMAQQKRPTPKPPPRATAAPTPAPTFETLVPDDSYTFYGEIRGVGQLIRSSAVNDLLEPVLKISGPPKEFRNVVKWLNAHSEEVMTSRMLIATGSTIRAKQAPETLIAIEFASAEEATKFTGTLNEFLATIMPTPEPAPKSGEGGNDNEKPKPTAPPDPGFHLQRIGSLLVITPHPWTMKQLRPAGSKLLAEDPNFRAARNRFTSEPIFVFVDMKAMERNDEESRKQSEEQRRLEEEQEKRQQAEAEPKGEPGGLATLDTLTEEEKKALAENGEEFEIPPPVGEVKDTPEPDPVSMLLSGIGSSFFSGASHMPEGIGATLAFEGDSFDLRVLLVSQSGERADALPFLPMLITGPALAPEAPNIFPADTDVLLSMSLDLPQIYAAMSKPQPMQAFIKSRGAMIETKVIEPEAPFAALEQRLKIKLKDDLLPLLGSEIAVRLPSDGANMLGLPGMALPTASTTSEPATTGVIVGTSKSTEPQATNAAPVVAIAVKDKEGLRTLMPKLIDNFGFKGASSLMQTERREDTELVSLGNAFAYAFVGNFIVLSPDVASTRHVVDSYLKHETLAGDIQFKNSTRWQPRPLLGQVYMSPALMEGFRTWAQTPSRQVSDQVRAFLTRASTAAAQSITYSLSNEGLGPLHEVHIPKNLILMAVAGVSGEINPPQMVQNERMAIGIMHTIAYAEEEYKKKNSGAYATLEELMAADLVPKEGIEKSGYRFSFAVSGDKFEVTGVPVEYGQSGKLSLFLDHTRVVRGGDKGGAPASASDPPIN
ncbi:MAG TPA: hypothetical protein VFI24_29170 [Pyrinomonadaceae bacterium]|nr:hypothetical protein [Pyrinomonadaceae bacterium]